MAILTPNFTERVALEVRNRIVLWMQMHFTTGDNWTEPVTEQLNPLFQNDKRFTPRTTPSEYRLPVVRDFATSGDFDDLAESVVIRVLKDMHNFGTVKIRPSLLDSTQAGRTVLLCERLLEIGDNVHFTGSTYLRTFDSVASETEVQS
jgi:hypothetical protein